MYKVLIYLCITWKGNSQVARLRFLMPGEFQQNINIITLWRIIDRNKQGLKQQFWQTSLLYESTKLTSKHLTANLTLRKLCSRLIIIFDLKYGIFYGFIVLYMEIEYKLKILMSVFVILREWSYFIYCISSFHIFNLIFDTYCVNLWEYAALLSLRSWNV